MQWGAPTSKPTLVYSNASWITGLFAGPLKKTVREAQTRLAPVRWNLSQVYCILASGKTAVFGVRSSLLNIFVGQVNMWTRKAPANSMGPAT